MELSWKLAPGVGVAASEEQAAPSTKPASRTGQRTDGGASSAATEQEALSRAGIDSQLSWRRLAATGSVGLAAILNRKYVNRATLHSAESHAPIADSQPVSASEFPLQRFDVTFAGLSVTVSCEQNPHRDLAFDAARFGAGARSPNKVQRQRPNSRRISS